jgi:Iap family predicted aminopeptidase
MRFWYPFEFMFMYYSLLSFLVILLSATLQSFSQQVTAFTESSIKTDLEKVVCKNGERLDSVRQLFAEKGVPAEDIQIEKLNGVENLVVTNKGKSDEMIVIGAHYDKVKDGCGAIDNWTGIVVLSNLYSAFKKLQTDKTLVFVAFGKEEEGLVGSRAMAKKIPKEERTQYCSMVNLDSFGLAYPQILSNASTPKLSKFTLALAEELKMPSGEASLAGVADADSSSFKEKDIPAITLHGLSNKWQEIIHGSKDSIKNINMEAVEVALRFSTILLSRLDKAPCSEFRK